MYKRYFGDFISVAGLGISGLAISKYVKFSNIPLNYINTLKTIKEYTGNILNTPANKILNKYNDKRRIK